MAVFKCKMCGGTLEINNETVAVCQYCGTKQTLPKLDDDRKANLYDRANHFRRNNEFDKAESIYEQILTEDNTDSEVYWSLVLCRYGIEYVEDPATRKRIPTVNRAQFTSIFDDDNYKSAIRLADGYQKEIYEKEAKAINEIQKGILAISQMEEPFDVFICYKETDNSGRRTPDSVLANELYHQLTNEGFKVFYSRITLEDKLGQEYEPYIFAALNSAKVMVVLGTKPEYFNAVWVKNEWKRYLKLVKESNGKKILIPAFRDMDPYDLPEEFSHLQAQDMSKLGFMQDLIRAIKKISNTTEVPHIEVNAPTDNTNNISAILDRAFIHLETKEWTKANRLFEESLKINARVSDAYLGKCMIDLHIANKELIVKKGKSVLSNKNFKLAGRFAGEQQKRDLQKIVTEIQNNIKQQKAISKKRVKTIAKICLIAIICISLAFGGFVGYKNWINPMVQYSQANKLLNDGKYDEAIKKFENLKLYKDSEEKIKERDYFLSGKLYMRQHTKFIEGELGKGRSDITEGAELYVSPKNTDTYPDITFEEKDGDVYIKITEYKEKPADYRENQCFISYPIKNQQRNIFCMYTLWVNDIENTMLNIDVENMRNFGEYGIIITNRNEFLNRIALAIDKYDSVSEMECAFVNYMEEEKMANVMEMTPRIIK